MTKERHFRFDDWDNFQAEQDYHNEQSTWLNTVDMRAVEWLWDGFIPRGMVTIITGEEGLGKSQLALKIAAKFSTGTLEGQPAWAMTNPKDDAPGGLVKLYSAEDPLHQVLVPRMRANGANVNHVAAEGINIQTFLPKGVDDIARGISELGFGMVVIDPVIAYMDSKTDSNSAQDVRAVMRQLADLADISNTIIIGVMHPKKGEESQLLHKMIGGSSAFGQAARSVLAVGRHPDDEDWRVVGRIKGNLSKPPTPWVYEIEARTFTTPTGEDVKTSCVNFLEPVDEDFDFAAALSGRARGRADDTDVDEAMNWILSELTLAETVPADDMLKRGGKIGYSPATLKRAKKRLGVVSQRSGKHWVWKMP